VTDEGRRSQEGRAAQCRVKGGEGVEERGCEEEEESSGVGRVECKNPTRHKLAALIDGRCGRCYVIFSRDLNFK
jgi:hypothetical protein